MTTEYEPEPEREYIWHWRPRAADTLYLDLVHPSLTGSLRVLTDRAGTAPIPGCGALMLELADGSGEQRRLYLHSLAEVAARIETAAAESRP